MTKEYTHELNEEVRSVSGGYTLDTESTLDVDGREVLYVLGSAVVDSSCCGMGGCRYALVPGFISKLKDRRNQAGLWVSDVEPVVDEAARKRITRLIEQRETVQQIQFWG
ncbi:MAG: hypothetical protein KKB20_13385 [Proteobacteria bacterium]|nr:hypothetical protein [Pseudomonadota bacterium]